MLTHNRIGHDILALTQARDRLDLMVAEQYTPYKTDPDADVLKQPGLLQMFQFAADEERHLEILMSQLELHGTDKILDLGCGTGRLAEWLQAHCPTVEVTQLNRNLAQLSCCRPDSDRVAGDMLSLPFRGHSFDAVIMAYSLGYGLVDDVFAESARILKPGGQLLLYDLACRDGRPANYMLVTLGYKVYDWLRVVGAARRVDLTLSMMEKVTTEEYIHPAFLKFPYWLLGVLLQEIEPICAVFRRAC